jgi:tetratricopeptide (TPR) repeat protein
MRKLIILAIGIVISTNLFSQEQNLIQDLELRVLKGQYDSALVLANKIIQEDSLSGTAYYYKGRSLFAKYKYFEAMNAFETANSIDSANLIIEVALAETYDMIGKDENAIQIYYEQFLRDTNDIKPIVKLANVFRKSREYGSAIHYYQKATFIDPENFYYYKQQAYCASKISMNLPAIYAYESAVMFNPYDLGTYQQLANLYNSERYFNDAISTCNKGLKNYPDDTQLLKIKAYANYLNRDFDSSIVQFNYLLEQGDTSVFNLKYRGFSHFEKKKFVNAIQDLLCAYEINRDDPELCFYLGSALVRSNQNKEGMVYLNKSLKLLSPSPDELSNIYSEMANVYLNQKKYKESLGQLKLAYRNDAKPILSFKMGQLYDYYLDNKKLAIDCYEGYLTLSNVSDSTKGAGKIIDSFIADPRVVENAKERIRILNEEMFFENTKKE